MTQDLVHGGNLDWMQNTFANVTGPWIDLSTGINPWPWPVGNVPNETMHHLPMEAEFNAARLALADAIGAPQESIVLAPGSELLISLLPTIIRPKKVAIVSPSYSNHARSWAIEGCQRVESPDPLSFAHDADVVVVCNPNNPDGRVFSPASLDAARKTLAARNGWLIIDEAYADLNPEISLASMGGASGLIVLRSIGKFYGLAGIRIGAILAPREILHKMAQRLGEWSVSGQALYIASRAYRDFKWQEHSRRRLQSGRETLDHILQRAGFKICGGTNLFAFVETDDAYKHWLRLAENAIYVRRFEWSKRHLRVGLPPDEAAERRLMSALSL